MKWGLGFGGKSIKGDFLLHYKKEEFDKKEMNFSKKLVMMRKHEDFSSNIPIEHFSRRIVKIQQDVITLSQLSVPIEPIECSVIFV